MRIKQIFTIVLLFIFFLSHSQEWKPEKESWNHRIGGGELLKSIGIGILVQGQTSYPEQYSGPAVSSLYNEGAYGIFMDLYIKKLIIGLQITDEYFFLTGGDDSIIRWKPRGFNDSFSSLTRTLWFSLGYNIFSDLYLKVNIGQRRGPSEGIVHSDTPSNEVASGFDFNDVSSIYNNEDNLIDAFSEIDFSFGFNYPVVISDKLSLVPELGYSFNYGGVITGISLKRSIKK